MTNQPTSVYIENNGLRFHAIDHGGEGKPIALLVHGAIAHSRWWDSVVPRLNDLIRPVTVDMRGHGESDWSDDYSYETFCSDLKAWIDWARREGGQPPGVIAHSFGGLTALKLHENGVPDLRFLVVIDVPLELDDRILGPMRRIAENPDRPWDSKEAFIEKFRVVPNEGKIAPRILKEIARHSIRQKEDGTWVLKADKTFHRNRPGTSLRASWQRVRAPAMLIVGGVSDRLLSGEIEWLRENCPGVRLETIPNAHHHVFLDQPEAFIRITRDFIAPLLI